MPQSPCLLPARLPVYLQKAAAYPASLSYRPAKKDPQPLAYSQRVAAHPLSCPKVCLENPKASCVSQKNICPQFLLRNFPKPTSHSQRCSLLSPHPWPVPCSEMPHRPLFAPLEEKQHSPLSLSYRLWACSQPLTGMPIPACSGRTQPLLVPTNAAECPGGALPEPSYGWRN